MLDYGFPRLLICERDGIAAMLLANHVHMESATAVLGGSQVEAGLPVWGSDALAATTVFVLHDATAAGAAWRAGHGAKIWLALTLELWLRAHLD